ncbi:hypothetical protein CC86DRAFT_256078, partial [Ophiobolus disseminans]
LCMDHNEKVLVPFRYFVEPTLQLSRTPPCQPFHFLRLHMDLQLIVYECCDLSTLFQLMRTCSRTRGPAAKYFWANTLETYWYHSSDYCLFDYGSHQCPIIRHCPEFARRIKKVELNLLRLEHFFAELGEQLDGPYRPAVSTATKAQDFWSKVERAFPAVKKMVLTGMLPRRALPPPPGEFDIAYPMIETVLNCALPHIAAYVAFDRGNSPRSRSYTLWQVTSGLESTWQVVNKHWTPTRILLPPRRFTDSPLRDLLTFTRMNYALHLETRGLDWLKIETYARYPLDGVIRCPRLDCDATFTERSQWKQHLHDTSHWRLGPGYTREGDWAMELLCFKGTPISEQAAVEARQQRIDAGYKHTKKFQWRVGCGWSQEGTEQRRLFEE